MKKLSVADWYKWFCSTEAHLANVLIGSRPDNTSGLSYSVKVSWQTLVHWFSVFVLPAKYPSSVLEVSFPVEVAKLQGKAQHFKTVLKAVPLGGSWNLAAHSFVLVQVVKLLRHRVS